LRQEIISLITAELEKKLVEEDIQRKKVIDLTVDQFAIWVNNVSRSAFDIFVREEILTGEMLVNYVKRKGEAGLTAIGLKQGVIVSILERIDRDDIKPSSKEPLKGGYLI